MQGYGKSGNGGLKVTIDMSGSRAVVAKNAYRRALTISGSKSVHQLESWAEQSQALRSGMEEKHYVQREVQPTTGRHKILLDPQESPSTFLVQARTSSALIAEAKDCVAVRVEDDRILVLFTKSCKVADLRTLGKEIGLVLFGKAGLPRSQSLDGWQDWKTRLLEAKSAPRERVLAGAGRA